MIMPFILLGDIVHNSRLVETPKKYLDGHDYIHIIRKKRRDVFFDHYFTS